MKIQTEATNIYDGAVSVDTTTLTTPHLGATVVAKTFTRKRNTDAQTLRDWSNLTLHDTGDHKVTAHVYDDPEFVCIGIGQVDVMISHETFANLVAAVNDPGRESDPS